MPELAADLTRIRRTIRNQQRLTAGLAERPNLEEQGEMQ
jgi:hypothetical protein